MFLTPPHAGVGVGQILEAATHKEDYAKHVEVSRPGTFQITSTTVQWFFNWEREYLLVNWVYSELLAMPLKSLTGLLL